MNLVQLRRRHIPDGLQDRGVAFEAAAESDLPDLLPSSDAPGSFEEVQLVPDRGGRHVSPAPEGVSRGLEVVVREVEVCLDGVEHRAAPRVDAKVVHRAGEVRHVALDALHLEPLAHHKVDHEAQLLVHRQDERPEHGDVGLHGLARAVHHVLLEAHAHLARRVLLLEDALVRVGVRALVGAHGVQEGVLGSGPVRVPPGEEHRGATHAEERVGDEHALLVAQVEVLR
mmetsp:Transcript_24825/g.83246  ORF Transcript_24825/g.83246 Transcript_24825/m.83246 type:complete len:228 (-) Transcript_24825:872-1555(-)